MKPDKITCNNCGKQIDKGKWCSDKCRMAFKRTGQPEQTRTESTAKPEQIVPEHEQTSPNKLPEQPKGEQPEQFRSTLTKTDKTFYDRAMEQFGEPYYNFTSPLRESKCLECGDKFTTRLSLNKYCSYAHYRQMA